MDPPPSSGTRTWMFSPSDQRRGASSLNLAADRAGRWAPLTGTANARARYLHRPAISNRASSGRSSTPRPGDAGRRHRTGRSRAVVCHQDRRNIERAFCSVSRIAPTPRTPGLARQIWPWRKLTLLAERQLPTRRGRRNGTPRDVVRGSEGRGWPVHSAEVCGRVLSAGLPHCRLRAREPQARRDLLAERVSR